jgi:hypothetical protein
MAKKPTKLQKERALRPAKVAKGPIIRPLRRGPPSKFEFPAESTNENLAEVGEGSAGPEARAEAEAVIFAYPPEPKATPTEDRLEEEDCAPEAKPRKVTKKRATRKGLEKPMTLGSVDG